MCDSSRCMSRMYLKAQRVSCNPRSRHSLQVCPGPGGAGPASVRAFSGVQLEVPRCWECKAVHPLSRTLWMHHWSAALLVVTGRCISRISRVSDPLNDLRSLSLEAEADRQPQPRPRCRSGPPTPDTKPPVCPVLERRGGRSGHASQDTVLSSARTRQWELEGTLHARSAEQHTGLHGCRGFHAVPQRLAVQWHSVATPTR